MQSEKHSDLDRIDKRNDNSLSFFKKYLLVIMLNQARPRRELKNNLQQGKESTIEDSDLLCSLLVDANQR